MATFVFDGNNSQTLDFDIDEDQVVFELEASEVASFVDTPQGATLTTSSGATLVFAGLTLVQLADANFLPESLIQVDDNDSNNNLFAGAEGSFIVANDGNDFLEGDEGDDVFFGNMGGDELHGHGGSDRLYGGMDDDTILVDGGPDSDEDTVLAVGGQGADDIDIGNGSVFRGDVTVFGGNGTDDPADEGDLITAQIGVEGTAQIFGNGGDDIITVGGQGNVTVNGGLDDDSITSVGNGDRSLLGGLGADTITITSTGLDANLSIFGGNGINDTDDEGDTISVALSSNADVEIFGNGGGDAISINVAAGSTGDIYIHGGAANDSILSVVGDGLNDGSEVFGGAGSDTIDVTVSAVAGGASVEITGGNGVDDTNDSADEITVGLNGAESEATIYGNAGADEIVVTGAGEATVFGGLGADTIEVGGVGQFELAGGADADTFNFQIAAFNGDATVDDVSSIVAINFDDDNIALEATTIAVAVDLSEATAAQQTSINAEISLSEAADQALELASANIADGTAVGVLFNYNGESYVAAGISAAAPDAEDAGFIVQVTGFTGDFDLGSFSTFTSVA